MSEDYLALFLQRKVSNIIFKNTFVWANCCYQSQTGNNGMAGIHSFTFEFVAEENKQLRVEHKWVFAKRASDDND